jgi:SAM-dependent MidA family methyltransferase
LQTSSSALNALIRDEIVAQGPIPFAQFMEQALYHPGHGYYSSGRTRIGRQGDYFTNASVGPVFGRLLATQLTEIWRKLGTSDEFVIVEQGAHRAEFARDVLESIRQDAPEFFPIVRFCVVEPFPLLRDQQIRTLEQFSGKVEWRDTVAQLDPFTGVYCGNELFDALPVHLIVSGGANSGEPSWLERHVDFQSDQFVFVDRLISNAALAEHVKTLPARPAGYQTEVNLAALELIDQLSARLTRGYILATDYGFPRAEFYAAHRTGGTLQSRAQHRVLGSPFAAVGASDLTAHVEWTSIAERAGANGLDVAGFADQHHFLTGILANVPQFAEKASPKTHRALQTLIHPEMLGRSFQVLALARNVEGPAGLSGLKFARDSHTALGLA